MESKMLGGLPPHRLLINTLSVVAHAQLEMPLIESDLHCDPLRVRVAEGVAQCLAGDAVRLVTNVGVQITARAFYLHINCRRLWRRCVACEFFCHCSNCFDKIARVERRRPQSLQRITGLADRVRGLIDCTVKCLLGFYWLHRE